MHPLSVVIIFMPMGWNFAPTTETGLPYNLPSNNNSANQAKRITDTWREEAERARSNAQRQYDAYYRYRYDNQYQ